jgi:hypothetical protein
VVSSQKFAAWALVERRYAAVLNGKVQQILHSTFGYVQDDKILAMYFGDGTVATFSFDQARERER